MNLGQKFFCAALLAATSTPAVAAPVVPGQWYSFAFGGPGSAFTNGNQTFPDAPTVRAPDAPWTFTLSKAGFVTFVDGYNSGDQFTITDFGNTIGTTSLPTQGSGCGGNIPLCLANPAFTKGVFALAAGSHSLSGTALQSPFGAGAAFFQISPVPEPATWAMMVAGFGVIGFAMRRRQAVRMTYSFA